jgi:hypothetical protein
LGGLFVFFKFFWGLFCSCCLVFKQMSAHRHTRARSTASRKLQSSGRNTRLHHAPAPPLQRRTTCFPPHARASPLPPSASGQQRQGRGEQAAPRRSRLQQPPLPLLLLPPPLSWRRRGCQRRREAAALAHGPTATTHVRKERREGETGIVVQQMNAQQAHTCAIWLETAFGLETATVGILPPLAAPLPLLGAAPAPATSINAIRSGFTKPKAPFDSRPKLALPVPPGAKSSNPSAGSYCAMPSLCAANLVKEN